VATGNCAAEQYGNEVSYQTSMMGEGVVLERMAQTGKIGKQERH
jgi:hypothetical protein